MEKARLRTGETLHHNHAIPNGADVVERNGRLCYLAAIDFPYVSEWNGKNYSRTATHIYKFLHDESYERVIIKND